MFRRLIASLVCTAIFCTNCQYVQAQPFNINQLPVPGTMIDVSAPFAPISLKGLVINTQKPLEFQFIVDTGRGPQDTASIKEETNRLVKYFLAGLTIPEGELWVNLSPYEKNRITTPSLGQTELGRDLLAQDYILKQLTASLIYPEKDLGKEFWSRVYAKAQAEFGSTNMPVNTFNKVWILPDQAQVFENGPAAYVTQSTLKVMLDEDFLAKQKHNGIKASSISSQIVRQIVLPEISKEVNTGRNFAPLRQIYNAMILAKWYKETIANGLLDALYTNKNKTAGVNLTDPSVKEQIYQRYLQAYKKGVFNYIKEEPMISSPNISVGDPNKTLPKKYFSGGVTELRIPVDTHGTRDMIHVDGAMTVVTIGLVVASSTAIAALGSKFLKDEIRFRKLKELYPEIYEELKSKIENVSQIEGNSDSYIKELLSKAVSIIKNGKDFDLLVSGGKKTVEEPPMYTGTWEGAYPQNREIDSPIKIELVEKNGVRNDSSSINQKLNESVIVAQTRLNWILHHNSSDNMKIKLEKFLASIKDIEAVNAIIKILEKENYKVSKIPAHIEMVDDPLKPIFEENPLYDGRPESGSHIVSGYETMEVMIQDIYKVKLPVELTKSNQNPNAAMTNENESVDSEPYRNGNFNGEIIGNYRWVDTPSTSDIENWELSNQYGAAMGSPAYQMSSRPEHASHPYWERINSQNQKQNEAMASDQAPGVMKAEGMPLMALKDPKVLDIFRQIVERRFDVRMLSEIYHLGPAPDKLTHKGRQYSVSDYAKLLVNFLIDRINEDPFEVSKAFRSEFPNMARPPELNSIFDAYMKIKMEKFDMEVLKDGVPPRSIVADIGAGKNRLGQAILEFSDEKNLRIRRVIGTDLNDWPDRNSNVDQRLAFVTQESGTYLPLPSNSLNAVIVKWVLHHMPPQDQVAFLRSVWRVLKPGGRLIIFDSLGVEKDQADIMNDFERETKNPQTWPRGSFYDDNLKLSKDYMALNPQQQLQVDALEDYFGHNLVMARDAFMPQFFTYLSVKELRQLMTRLGFEENAKYRRVFGSAPIMRMGPPSLRIVFNKPRQTPLLIGGGGGENKEMFLIKGLNDSDRKTMTQILDVLVRQDRRMIKLLETREKVNDLVLIGNDRLDTFAESLEVVNSGLADRIVILGEFGRATISMIERAVALGYDVKISPTVVVNSKNWSLYKKQITPKNQRDFIRSSEAEIIKDLLIQMIKKFPYIFENLDKKLSQEGDGFIVTVGDPYARDKRLLDNVSPNYFGHSTVSTNQVFLNYRRLLDKEGVFNNGSPFKIMIMNTPIRQLRAQAYLESDLAAERARQKVEIIGHTVSFDNVPFTRSAVIKEILGEIWRIVIYSEYGSGDLNLRSDVLPKGIDSLTQEFWSNVYNLIDSLGREDKKDLARELIELARNFNGISLNKIVHDEAQNKSVSQFVKMILKLSQDSAMKAPIRRGGIDLNHIAVKRTGHVIQMKFDPFELSSLEKGGFEGFSPVIINIQRISSPFALLGLNVTKNPAKEPELLVKA